MPNDRQKLFLEGPIGKALVRFAIPITLGNLLQTGYQMMVAITSAVLGAAGYPLAGQKVCQWLHL
jgi:Na+-driven multidrug efflux pump